MKKSLKRERKSSNISDGEDLDIKNKETRKFQSEVPAEVKGKLSYKK